MSLLDPSIWSGKIFINGWTASGGGTAAVTEPASGSVLGK